MNSAERYSLRHITLLGLCICTAFFMVAYSVSAQGTRIKDIVSIETIRDNQLVGLGLVVGLDGTGDTLRNVPYTTQQIAAMLERLGTNIKGVDMKPENIATVMVTATLPAFARSGTRIDVNVASAGDAEDLRGGVLLVTPLTGADGEIYAVAQGSVAIAGFSAGGDASGTQQGVPTSGRISNGAIIEREIGFELNELNAVKLSLHNPDLTTASRVAMAINAFKGMPVAEALDPSTVQIIRPAGVDGTMVSLLTDIEQLEIRPDQYAKVIIDERTGIIVMGNNVTISPLAVAHGNLTITITEMAEVSQPGALSRGGNTEVVPRTLVDVDDGAKKRRLAMLNRATTLQELVDGLNALGFGPRDMITILQAIKAAGAMQAELQVL